MLLTPGTRLGAYEVLSLLGTGGMGEVYRARDTKLDRDVAIKVLPETFVSDPERVARFQREAKTLAALNHPHIGSIYGLEDAGGAQALVLELVEGPTLAERIAQGPIPLDEALPIARQIAEALEAAHEAGIIHRDLKPANIKLRVDGTIKILDFGLAKAIEPLSGMSASVTTPPTITSPAMTQMGVILGTAAYMSPEQARGRQVDKRTDVWAFGCLLFEMLGGRRAFDGEDVTETLGALIHKEPSWELLPASTPAAVRTTLKRCLQKDPKQRIRDSGDVRLALEGAFESPGAAVQSGPARAAFPWWLAAAIVGSVLAASGVTAVAMVIYHRLSTKPPRPARFALLTPAMQSLNPDGVNRDIAISPGGTHIVYRGGAGGQPQLIMRAIDDLNALALGSGNTGGSRAPFFSPNGQWVGYFEGTELKKVSISGGPPIVVCRLNGGARGGSWGEDDQIYFATSDNSTGLMRVPAAGGEPTVMTRPDASRGEGDHLYPSALPQGRGVLFTIAARSASQMENAQIAVFDTKTKQTKTVMGGGSQAEYVETGHLVYGVSGSLRAVPFDLARLEVTGDPVPVAERVLMSVPGTANFVVSRNGTLVYVPGGTIGLAPRSLVWVNRQGQEESIKAPPRAYVSPRISPDGTRIALQIADQEYDIWVLNGQTLTRLTFDPAVEQLPVWTPDGRRIIFNSQRGGTFNLFWHAADGTGPDHRLTTTANPQNPFSLTPDGKHLLLGEVSTKRGPDVVQLDLNPSSIVDGKGATTPLVQTNFAEFGPDVSPDGRWVAYQSSDSGAFQIYVRPYPDVDSGRWQVSPDGGTKPLWAKTGRELFYVDSNNTLMTVPVQTKGRRSLSATRRKYSTRSTTTAFLVAATTFQRTASGF